ncbi:MAG: hypothetical protein OXC11_14475 [Rhodospirillales bacterium]|nr:hypothetical protein [Rhodospirillales bacterium]
MTSLRSMMRADTRRAILQALALDPGYSLNDRILRVAVDRMEAITLDESAVREHLAWLEDRGAVTTDTVPPFILAKLTDYGLSISQGHAQLEGVSRPLPSQV